MQRGTLTITIAVLFLSISARSLGAVGDDCGQALLLTLPAALPYTDVNTTCGRGNDYDETCLGTFDDGEDLVYALVLTQPLNLRIHLDGDGYEGLALDTVCPPSGACLALERDSSGTAPLNLDVQLATGTYYLLVDTAPPPACSHFALTIEELPPLTPGDSCTTPHVVNLPADLPVADLGQTTCGRYDFYSDYPNCLGDWLGGEEFIYELHVTAPAEITVTLDPLGATHAAIALDDTCPPSGLDCLASAYSDTAAPLVLDCLRLTPGTYTLIVDRLPSVAHGECLPAFDLRIEACALPRGACCVGTSCTGTLTEAQCAAQSGTWHAGHACGMFACPVELPALPEACAMAHVIPAVPFSATFNNAPAGPDGPRGSCNAASAPAMQNDVWLVYTAARDAALVLHLAYQYNGLAAVYAGPSCAQLTEIACVNADWYVPDTDTLAFDVVAGQTYWFQIGDYGAGPQGGETLLALCTTLALCPGDANCDGSISWRDIDFFVAAMNNNVAAWQVMFAPATPGCDFANNDVNGDGTVSWRDIDAFVAVMNTPCP